MAPPTDRLDAFALELLAASARTAPTGEVVLSPWSVALALAQLACGARGETADELHRALGTADPASLGRLDAELRAGPDDGLSLSVANRLWVDEHVELVPEFAATLRDVFGTSLGTLEPPMARAVATINDWVAERTAGMVRDLFGHLDEDTALVLANAVHLKATWTEPLDPARAERAPFRRLDGSTVEVELLVDDDVSAGEVGGWLAAEKPYGPSRRFSMLFLLPPPAEPGALPDAATYAAALAALHPGAQLALPRFSLTGAPDLQAALQALGVRAAFGGRADLRGIDARGRLRVDQAVHKARIELDERGTEAAAATGLAIRRMSVRLPELEVRLDRPFVALVRDTRTGVVLFATRVVDPGGSLSSP